MGCYRRAAHFDHMLRKPSQIQQRIKALASDTRGCKEPKQLQLLLTHITGQNVRYAAPVGVGLP